MCSMLSVCGVCVYVGGMLCVCVCVVWCDVNVYVVCVCSHAHVCVGVCVCVWCWVENLVPVHARPLLLACPTPNVIQDSKRHPT